MMSNLNLKLLDWGSLFHNSYDDQYDSDETLCEEEVGDQTAVRKRFQPDSDNSTSIVSRSSVKNQKARSVVGSVGQAELKNPSRSIFFKTTFPNNENNITGNYHVQSENIEAEIRESGISTYRFPLNLTSVSENLNKNCSDGTKTSLGFLTTNSKYFKNNYVGDESNVYSSLSEFTLNNMDEKNYYTSESTFGFTDLSLNQTSIENNSTSSNKKGLSEPLETTQPDLGNLRNYKDGSESTDTALKCFEVTTNNESKTDIKAKEWPKENTLNESSEKDGRFVVESHLLKISNGAKQIVQNHGPNFLSYEQAELHRLSSRIALRTDQSKKNDMLKNVLDDIKLANIFLPDINNHDGGQSNIKNEDSNLDSVYFYFTGSLGSIDNETFNEAMTGDVNNLTNEKQPDAEISTLLTANCFLGISTESLVNIIGSDLVEETVEDMNISRGRECSPPLTLIEKTSRKYIKSEKKFPHKKRDIPGKILPARTCSSKYVNQSKRFTKSEEPPESSLRSSSTKTVKTKETKTTYDSLPHKKESDECAEVQKAEWIGMKIGRGTEKKKLKKVSTRNKFLLNEKNVKATVLQNLYEMEQTLVLIEKRTCKWVNEKEHFLSREKAFDMLMETQRIAKILTSLRVPMKSKLCDFKNKLSERAQKLALAIDVAIAESDQMLREECYEKLFNETSTLYKMVKKKLKLPFLRNKT